MNNTLATDMLTPPKSGESAHRPLLRITLCAFLVLAGALTLLLATDAGNADQQRIVEGMVRAQATRFERFEGYSRTQHYSVTTSRFDLKANLVARIHRDRVKGKSYEIISRSGSPVIQEPCVRCSAGVCRRWIPASSQATGRILPLTPENYSFFA